VKSKRWLFATLWVLSLAAFLQVACGDSSPEGANPWPESLEGTYVLESATFREPVDIDGAGGRPPTTDAKALLYEAWRVYDNCSTIWELIFEFTEPGNDVHLICPETEIANEFGRFTYEEGNFIYLFSDVWDDLDGAVDAGAANDLLFRMEECEQTDAGWDISGFSDIYLPIFDPGRVIVFDFQLRAVVVD